MPAGLTRTRDSIGRATATALSGAACQAAARILRMIADAMEGAESARRIDLLYLVDSILQVRHILTAFTAIVHTLMAVVLIWNVFCKALRLTPLLKEMSAHHSSMSLQKSGG